MPLFTSDRERRLWFWVAVVMVAIYSSLGPSQMLAEWLRERNLLRVSVGAAMLLAGAFLAWRWAKTRPGWREIGVAVGVAFAYLWALARVGVPPAERTHLIEYAVVAAFIYQALVERRLNGRRVPAPDALAVTATALLGWLDEGIQSLLPNRVYDIRDVFFNFLAGVMFMFAALFIALVRRRKAAVDPRGARWPNSLPRRSILPRLAVLAVPLGFAAYLGFGPQPSIDPASLPRSSFTWNEEQLRVGFAYWDSVFPGREVPRGAEVRALPLGPPLRAFSAGGALEKELERFIAEQEVAGLIVLHEGEIRLERYGLGHSESGRWTSQSVAKSVTSTLVGAAVEDGSITSIDDPVTKYVPGLRGSAYDSVSIRHLMTMTSGVRWNEDYSDQGSDVVRFYSAPVEPGLDPTVSYMRRLPAEAAPGTKWVYKTGETHLLGVLVSSATGQTRAYYLSSKLWSPLGMEQPASWSIDRSGHELAGCCLQAALRDYARFGQFVLDGGGVGGESIVPDGWFEAATRTQVRTERPGLGYGYQWWTRDGGTFQAIGIHGQLLHIDRARRVVVVINSAWQEAGSPARWSARDDFLSVIASAMDDEDSN
jgi:CubicO group peptidase (beta-lactamase class C family)